MGGEELEFTLEPVPISRRVFSSWDILAIWFGAGISIAEFWAGALLTPGLPLLIALLVIIIGHVVGNALMGLIAIAGGETGVPTMVLSRGSLGVKGSILPSVLNYLQLIGWTAIMIIVGARALNVVLEYTLNLSAYHYAIVFLGALVTLWTFIGPKRWRLLEKIAATLLLMLSLWLLYITIVELRVPELLGSKEPCGMNPLLGLDLVIAMPVSWAPLIADYSRLSKNIPGAFWGTFIGYFISSSLFYAVGSITNLAIGEVDPIGIIVAYGVGIPAMLIIIFSTTTTTFLDIYSAAITIKNVIPKVDVKKQIITVGAIGTVIALLFPMEEYEWFLLLIGGAFVSLSAIMVIDYFVVKRGYEPHELLKVNGKYWYNRGYNIVAITCWAIGFIFYMLLASTLLLSINVPIISSIALNLGSTVPTLILTSILYLVLSRTIGGKL